MGSQGSLVIKFEYALVEFKSFSSWLLKIRSEKRSHAKAKFPRRGGEELFNTTP